MNLMYFIYFFDVYSNNAGTQWIYAPFWSCGRKPENFLCQSKQRRWHGRRTSSLAWSAAGFLVALSMHSFRWELRCFVCMITIVRSRRIHNAVRCQVVSNLWSNLSSMSCNVLPCAHHCWALSQMLWESKDARWCSTIFSRMLLIAPARRVLGVGSWHPSSLWTLFLASPLEWMGPWLILLARRTRRWRSSKTSTECRKPCIGRLGLRSMGWSLSFVCASSTFVG